MQLRFPTPCTREEYVTGQLWRKATFETCPAHPEGGCSFRRHTPYERKTPVPMMIARGYCPEAHCTFSLLPDFLAARVPGTLAEVEEAAHAADQGTSLEATAEALRPDVELQGALRWLRRRVRWFREGISAVLGALPAFTEIPKTPTELAAVLGGRVGQSLVQLRAQLAPRLPRIVAPFGFLARCRAQEIAEVDFNNRRARRSGCGPP